MLRGLPRRQAAPYGHVEQQELAVPLAVQHPRPGLVVLGLQHSTQTVKAAAHIPARALLRACCVPCWLLPLPMLLTCQISGQASLGPITSKLSYIYRQESLHKVSKQSTSRASTNGTSFRGLGVLSLGAAVAIADICISGPGRLINSEFSNVIIATVV